ncbi:hypothetical protein [Micropruina sonneratiae]|uniref:hypothetical protein n=1 Tax=Micropruina sonneratiae TaxID=2986940 RepID=UPI002225C432|nr:hypothetical protein [Micropruina sp. KQZ13P-5]MCW3158647.1 hypothetical protein [Micropruina sp. KQZ13P-5]
MPALGGHPKLCGPSASAGQLPLSAEGAEAGLFGVLGEAGVLGETGEFGVLAEAGETGELGVLGVFAETGEAGVLAVAADAVVGAVMAVFAVAVEGAVTAFGAACAVTCSPTTAVAASPVLLRLVWLSANAAAAPEKVVMPSAPVTIQAAVVFWSFMMGPFRGLGCSVPTTEPTRGEEKRRGA